MTIKSQQIQIDTLDQEFAQIEEDITYNFENSVPIQF